MYDWDEIKAADPDVATPEYKAAYTQARRDFELGMRVRELRIAQNMSQSVLARRVGTRQPNIARLEAGGGMPRLETLERLAAALGADLEVSLRPRPRRRNLSQMASDVLSPLGAHFATPGSPTPARAVPKAAAARKTVSPAKAKAAAKATVKKAVPAKKAATAKAVAPANATAKKAATKKAAPRKAVPAKAAASKAAPVKTVAVSKVPKSAKTAKPAPAKATTSKSG